MASLPLEQPLHLWTLEEAPTPLREQEPFPEHVFRFFLSAEPDEDYWVSGTVYVMEGRMSVGRLTIEPNTLPPRGSPPAKSIGSRLLRRLSITQLTDRVLARIRAQPETVRILREAFPDLVDSPAMPVLHEGMAAEAPRRGRPPRIEFHEQIAKEYLALQADGFGRGIIKELARRHDVPRETARDWVRRARRQGFLSDGTPGKAGAEPGPRLLALLMDTPAVRKSRRKG